MGADEVRKQRVAELITLCPDSHAEIAEKLDVDKSLVTRWRSGARKPNDEQLAKLEELYGGERAEPPREEPPPSKPKTPVRRPLDDGGDDDEPDEGNNARLRRFIRDGIRELDLDTELSGVKRAEALKKLVDAQVALDKSTGENALTTTKIVAHPEFKRAVRTITDAIAPCPTCLKAVIDSLEKVRG